MAGVNIKPTKRRLGGQAIDERVRALLREAAPDGTSTQFGVAGQLGTGGIGGGIGDPDVPIPGNPWVVYDISIAASATTDINLGSSVDIGSARGFITAKRGSNFFVGFFLLLHDGTTGAGQMIGGIAQPAAGNLGLTITGVLSGANFLLRATCDGIDGNTTKVNVILSTAPLQT